MEVDNDGFVNPSEEFKRPALSFTEGAYNGWNPLFAGNQPAPGRTADWNWLSLYMSTAQSALQTGAVATGSKLSNVSIFSLSLPDMLPGSVLFAGTGGLVSQNNSSLFWDNANSILKLGSENALQFASTSSFQPFRIMTNHYTNAGITDPALTIGYNVAAGGAASVSNPITPGVAQLQIALEANWSPTGAYTQVEFNHDYWSPDGLTHRRAFLHQLRNDTYVGNWLWFADTYSWSDSSNSTTYLTVDGTSLIYRGSDVSLGTVIHTGTSNIINNSGNPTIVLNQSGAAANNRLWDFFLSSTTLEFRLVNDAISSANDWMRVTRSANQATLINMYTTTFSYYTAYTDTQPAFTAQSGNIGIGVGGSTAIDTFLQRDAANTLNLASGTTGMLFRVSNTWTDSTHFEALEINWKATANLCSIMTQKGSAGGSTRNLAFGVGGTVYTEVRANISEMASAVSFGWSQSSDPGDTLDVILVRDGAAAILAQKNGGNAQTFRVYGTTTGSKYSFLTHNGTNGNLDVSSGRLILGGTATDIQWQVPLVALGGGAAPTLGTIGGSGPAAAAQNSWMQVKDSTGATFWVPVWK